MINMKNILYKKSKEEEAKLIAINKKLSIPYQLKNKYNVIIPMNIFQTWNSKKLPPLMAQTILTIKRTNPKFNYYLYDDNDCR